MKRHMACLFTACLLSLTAVSSCSGKLPELDDDSNGSSSDKSVYNMYYYGEIETLNYLQTDTEVDYALCANLVDCLVDYDQYGNILPGLAESWSSNEDMSEWTFNI